MPLPLVAEALSFMSCVRVCKCVFVWDVVSAMIMMCTDGFSPNFCQ